MARVKRPMIGHAASRLPSPEPQRLARSKIRPQLPRHSGAPKHLAAHQQRPRAGLHHGRAGSHHPLRPWRPAALRERLHDRNLLRRPIPGRWLRGIPRARRRGPSGPQRLPRSLPSLPAGDNRRKRNPVAQDGPPPMPALRQGQMVNRFTKRTNWKGRNEPTEHQGTTAVTTPSRPDRLTRRCPDRQNPGNATGLNDGAGGPYGHIPAGVRAP